MEHLSWVDITSMSRSGCCKVQQTNIYNTGLFPSTLRSYVLTCYECPINNCLIRMSGLLRYWINKSLNWNFQLSAPGKQASGWTLKLLPWSSKQLAAKSPERLICSTVYPASVKPMHCPCAESFVISNMINMLLLLWQELPKACFQWAL